MQRPNSYRLPVATTRAATIQLDQARKSQGRGGRDDCIDATEKFAELYWLFASILSSPLSEVFQSARDRLWCGDHRIVTGIDLTPPPKVLFLCERM